MPSPTTSSTMPTSPLLTHSDIANLWLLPDGVSDLLSNEAQKQEKLRFELTQCLIGQGYELICPPMIEYTESLLDNASEDLKRQTFKIIDQLTGRLMGVRADITPQILRIDAELNRHHPADHIARYCYAGHVIHTLPNGLFGSRTPLQLGAEIFGSASMDADRELLSVLFELLNSIFTNDATSGHQQTCHIDLGHVGIFERLCELAGLDEASDISNKVIIDELMTLYANKALPELKRLSETLPMGQDFYALASLGNDMTALRDGLSNEALSDNVLSQAIDDTRAIADFVQENFACTVSVDVTELSGYHYHTGLVFNVYAGEATEPLARGGRFHGMTFDQTNNQSSNRPSSDNSASNQEVNNTIRHAVGFSLDLTRLQELMDLPKQDCVVVDYDTLSKLDNEQHLSLKNKINELREKGKRVIKPLIADDGLDMQTHQLTLKDNEWVLNEVADQQ